MTKREDNDNNPHPDRWSQEWLMAQTFRHLAKFDDDPDALELAEKLEALAPRVRRPE